MEEVEVLAFQIVHIMTKTEGIPKSWEHSSNNPTVIGLKGSNGMLDENKINALISLDYNESKDIMNIKRYDYEFELLDSNGNDISSSGLTPNDAELSVALTRFTLINNETRKISFTLWKD